MWICNNRRSPVCVLRATGTRVAVPRKRRVRTNCLRTVINSRYAPFAAPHLANSNGCRPSSCRRWHPTAQCSFQAFLTACGFPPPEKCDSRQDRCAVKTGSAPTPFWCAHRSFLEPRQARRRQLAAVRPPNGGRTPRYGTVSRSCPDTCCNNCPLRHRRGARMRVGDRSFHA